jgi:hypothetical protein
LTKEEDQEISLKRTRKSLERASLAEFKETARKKKEKKKRSPTRPH